MVTAAFRDALGAFHTRVYYDAHGVPIGNVPDRVQGVDVRMSIEFDDFVNDVGLLRVSMKPRGRTLSDG